MVMNPKPVNISNLHHLYPFSSHFMDIDGHKYHYLDEGHGEPVVMLHGNPTWSFYYRKLVKGLRTDYRTIVPDHIGCGLSDKPDPRRYDYRLQSRVDDLARLIEVLDLKQPITLILHDWGGMIGMLYALKHPEKIGRFVIMNTAAFLPPPDKRIPLRLALIRNGGPLSTLAVLGFNLFAAGAVYFAAHQKLSREVRIGLKLPYNCWQNRIATLKFVQDIPLNKQDPSFALVKQADEHCAVFARLPMLICWGQHDFVFDSTYLNEWRRRFPAAEVHCFADAGHYVLEDVPEKILFLTRDFLKRQSCRQADKMTALPSEPGVTP